MNVYRLKTTAPSYFIFLHAPDGDFDFSGYSNVDDVRNFLATSPDYSDINLSDCQIVLYDRDRAQRLCDDQEGWFCCLEEYVDEI